MTDIQSVFDFIGAVGGSVGTAATEQWLLWIGALIAAVIEAIKKNTVLPWQLPTRYAPYAALVLAGIAAYAPFSGVEASLTAFLAWVFLTVQVWATAMGTHGFTKFSVEQYRAAQDAA